MSSGFTIVVFVTRKHELSPAEFHDHWENKHVPLLQRLAGASFPLSHTRHYLQRDETRADYPISPLVGHAADFTYDGFAVVSFASREVFQEFLPVMTSPEVLEDEERFTDRDKMKAVVLGDVSNPNIQNVVRVLYTRPFNPRSLAILAVAKANGLPLEVKTITSSKEAPEEYLKLNPLGKIPTFVGNDGFVLTESIAIAIYVTSQNEDTTLLGASKKDYSSILRWMAFGITEILPALGGWFNPLIGRAPFAPDAIQRSKEDTLFRMQMLDNHLRDRRYLVGDALSLADLFVVGIVQGAFRFFLEPAWRSEHPGVSGWFERVHSLPIVTDVSGPAALAAAEMPIAPPRWRDEDNA